MGGVLWANPLERIMGLYDASNGHSAVLESVTDFWDLSPRVYMGIWAGILTYVISIDMSLESHWIRELSNCRKNTAWLQYKQLGTDY